MFFGVANHGYVSRPCRLHKLDVLIRSKYPFTFGLPQVLLKRVCSLWVYFYLNPCLYVGSFVSKCTPQHSHNFPKFVDNKRDETCFLFWVGSPMRLKLGLYVGYIQWGILHTHLKTLFYGVHSPKPHEFLRTH